MRSDTDTIKALTTERGELMMRAGSLCGRLQGTIDTLKVYLVSLENCPGDPGNLSNIRYIQERLEAALNEYLDPETPF